MSQGVRPGSASVFLVSGGGRGITAQCVIRLAQVLRCRFILLGRSAAPAADPPWAVGCADEAVLKQRIVDDLRAQGEKPLPLTVQKHFQALLAAREIRQTLAAVAAAGGQAEYLCADVTHSLRLSAQLPAVTARLGPITGIIHGAGVLADKRIEQKSAADFEAVYAAKIAGLDSLLQVVPPAQLQHLVLFSSAAGFYGNPGQADYALANEILNKIAYRFKHDHPACHVLAFNWGPWDGGMVSPALKELFAARNIALIPVAGGTQTLVNELLYGDPALVQLVIGSSMAAPPAPLDPRLHQHRIRRRLILAANPFLQDHRIGDHVVLPSVCAMAWMGNAGEQLYPGYTLFTCENFKVLKGIVFDEHLAESYTLDLQEIAKTDGGEIVFEAKIWSTTATGKVRYHYSARMGLMHTIPPSPLYSHADLRPTEAAPGAPLYHDGTMFHGPSFQGIEQVLNVSRERVTIVCRLPHSTPAALGQFAGATLDPCATDVQFQMMLIWTRRFQGAVGLPLAAQRAEHYQHPAPGARFYVSLEVQTGGPNYLRADLIAHDADGRVYARILGAEATLSPQLNARFLQAGQRSA